MLVTMNDVLAPAKENGYGVGFFNAINVEMARAVIETAEELHAPVMIGTAESLLPWMEMELVTDYLLPMAERADVPVCVHFDHGKTFDCCMQALQCGFTSVMYDCSTLGYEENVKNVAEMVKICHAMGVTVEGELGHVGDNEGAGALERPEDFYTDPAMAKDFAERTGIDSLAVAVGNAHGDYKFTPKLDFDRIVTIADNTGLPLVLHGGSGLSDDDFKTAVKKGVAKVNIFTDINKAARNGLAEGIAAGVNNMKELMPYEINAMKETVAEKLTLFGSVQKA